MQIIRVILLVSGVFAESDVDLLRLLLQCCEGFRLPKRQPLRPADIGHSDRLLIQACASANSNSSLCAYFSADFRRYLQSKVSTFV